MSEEPGVNSQPNRTQAKEWAKEFKPAKNFEKYFKRTSYKKITAMGRPASWLKGKESLGEYQKRTRSKTKYVEESKNLG